MEGIYTEALEMGTFDLCTNFGEAVEEWLGLINDLRWDEGLTGGGWEAEAAHFFVDRFFGETVVQ